MLSIAGRRKREAPVKLVEPWPAAERGRDECGSSDPLRLSSGDWESRLWMMPSPSEQEQAEQRARRFGAEFTEAVRRTSSKQMSETQLRTASGGWMFGIELQGGGIEFSEFLDAYAPELTVVGHTEHELIWGLDLPEGEPDVDAYAIKHGGADGVHADAAEVEWLSASFRNYRSLRATSIELEPLTVLVGRNGAGKSNVLDALFRASLLTQRKPATVFKGPSHPERVVGRWSPRDGFSVAVRGTKDWAYEYTWRSASSVGADEWPFRAEYDGQEQHHASLLFTPLGQAFGGAVHLRLDASVLQRPTAPPRTEPFLRHDGLYLPSVLSYIVQNDRARFQAIIDRLRELVPAVEDLRTPFEELEGRRRVSYDDDGDEHKPRKPLMGNRLELEMRGVGWIPADQVSEGTLLALGLITVLSRPVAPRLILLDDIDRGLHPAAQRKLVELLQHFASTRTKIVCTSHSPYVFDPLSAQQVRVVVSDPDTGATTIHNFSDHHDWPKWSKTMSPADFWQYVGDETWPGEPSA